MGSFSPGDNIYFQRGETWPSGEPNLVITCAGSSGSQITFGAYGSGNKPVFDGNAIQCTSGNGYITVDNIEVKNTAGDGIAFSKTSGWQYDIKVTNCTVHDAGNVNIFLMSIDGYLIENCTSYNGYNGNIYVYGSDYGIKNGTVRGCTSYSTVQNDGIGIHEGDANEHCGANHIIEDCVCYDNAEEGIDVSDGSNVTVRDCECYGDDYAGYILEPFGGVTVERCIARDGNHGMHVGGSDVTIKNCLIYDNSYHGILVEAYYSASGLDIYHNTLVHPDSGNSGALIQIYDNMTDIDVKNNIISTKQSTYPSRLVYLQSAPGSISATFDYNLYYHPGGSSGRFYDGTNVLSFASWQSTHSQDLNGDFDNPDFTDQDNDDYTLTSVSPARNMGTNVGVTDDFDETSRPQETYYDAGAYEYSSGSDVQVDALVTTAGASAPGVSVETQGAGGGSWLTGWDYRKKITIQNANVDNDLTGFPLFVEFDNDADVAEALATGYDIRFTSDDGSTTLPYDRLYWDGGGGSNASGKFRVKCDPTATSAAEIYMYYGNSGASDGENAANTYDDNYLIFANLNESASTYDDAAGANDGTGDVDPTRGSGKFWYMQSFDGSTQSIDWGTISETSNIFFSFWFRCHDNTQNGMIICQDSNGSTDADFDIGFAGTYGAFVISSSDYRREIANTTFSDDTWYHVGIYGNLQDGNNSWTLYVNGSPQSLSSSTIFVGSIDTHLTLGVDGGSEGYWFDGDIETFKASNTERGESWNKFEYYNEGEADHELTWGSEESSSNSSVEISPAPLVVNSSVQAPSIYFDYSVFPEEIILGAVINPPQVSTLNDEEKGIIIKIIKDVLIDILKVIKK